LPVRGRYTPADPVAYGAPVVCPGVTPEVVTSAVVGTNDKLLEQVVKLWVTSDDRVIDVTCGEGVFWKSLPKLEIASSDIRHTARADFVADCRALPYANDSIDVAVFDPPYQPVHGKPGRSFGVGRSYALNVTQLQTINDVLELYRDSIRECARVLASGTGRLLVKCQDMTYNHRLHLVHLDIVRLMAAAGIDLADMFVLVNTSRMPQPTKRQQRAHRGHSYLLVGVMS
jgi:hypothetical protein